MRKIFRLALLVTSVARVATAGPGPVGVTFETSHSVVRESVPVHPLVLELHLAGRTALAAPLAVDLVAVGGNAALGADLHPLRRRAVFPRGARDGHRLSVPFAVGQDLLVEGDEHLDLALVPSAGAAVGAVPVHRVTVLDDDVAAVEFTAPASACDESAGTASVALALRGTSGAVLARPVAVRVATTGGSAAAGADHLPLDARVAWPAGTPVGSAADARVVVLDDELHEGDETVELALVGARGPAAIGPAAAHVLTIVDDDAPGPTLVGSARLFDLDGDGRTGAGDRVVLAFDEPVLVATHAADAFALPVAGDSFGAGAHVLAGPGPHEVTLTLGAGAVLRARGTFDAADVAENAPSGVATSGALPAGAITSLAGVDAEPAAAVDLVAGWVTAPNAPGGQDARAVVLGDVDGDGDLDAVVGNADAPDTVWTNDGHGAFSDSGQSLGPSATRDVELGDLDGDGDLDLVVGNDGEPDRVLVNDGTGTFTDSGQALGTSRTRALALGDLDGDGDLDLVVANEGQPNTVWLNAGGQLVDSGQSLDAGSTTALALVDVDRDGDLDAVFGNFDEGTTVYLGDGTGTLVDSHQDLHGRSLAILTGDVDGDGDADVVRAREGANTVWVNDGVGVYDYPGQVIGSSASRGAALRDLDADGDLDLVCADDWDEDHVYWNDGAGTFVDSGLRLPYDDSTALACGDLDGDGDPDLLVASRTGGCRVHLASLCGAFGRAQLVPGGPSFDLGAARAADCGDLDGDGRLDLVVAVDGPNRVLLGDGHGGFALDAQSPGLGHSTSVRLGDLDGDGDLDAVVGEWQSGDRVWLNDGSGLLVDSGQSLGSSSSVALALADLDRDGDLDLVVANAGAEPDTVWTNDGSGTFTDSGQALGAHDSRALALGDLDRDGDLDLVVGCHLGETRVHLGDGTGHFTDSGQAFGPLDVVGVALVDADRDGDLDVVTAGATAGGGRLLLNDGAAHLSDGGAALGSEACAALATGDVDGDGDQDLVVAGPSGLGTTWCGDGRGGFAPGASGPHVGPAASALVLADLDRDGDLDVVVVAAGGATRVLLAR